MKRGAWVAGRGGVGRWRACGEGVRRALARALFFAPFESGAAHEESGEREHHVLVQNVHDERAHAPVVIAAVDEKHGHEETELCDGEISRIRGLQTLLPRDAHAAVRGLDHRDVVRAVTDGERDGALDVKPDQFDEFGLLRRGAAAADDGVAILGEL